MSVTGQEIVKVDFSNVSEYQMYLDQLSLQMETVIYGMQDIGSKLVEMTDFSKIPPSGPTREYEVLEKYISEMTRVLYSIHDMQYAANRYVEYYDNLGVYEQGTLVYDEEAVDNVLTNFENLIYDGDWSTGLETNSFGFEVWENGILAGVDFIDSDRERAIRYNKKILDDLNNDLSRMKNNAVGYTEELRDSSRVYKMNLKPLADGVTVNSILQAFDIEDIDYQMLKAETEILGNIGSNLGDVLEEKASEIKTDVTIEVLKVLNPQYVAAKTFAQTKLGQGFSNVVLGDLYSLGYIISHFATWDDVILSANETITTMTNPFAFKKKFELGVGIYSDVQRTIEDEGYAYAIGQGLGIGAEVILTDGALRGVKGLSGASKVAEAGELTEEAVIATEGGPFPNEFVSESTYGKYQATYDNPKWFNQETGAVNWPYEETHGAIPDTVHIETLEPGAVIDRYGGEDGNFTSPEGTSLEERSLIPASREEEYHQYVVLKKLEVEAGEVAPWFDEPGGGIQYYTKEQIERLLIEDYLEEIK